MSLVFSTVSWDPKQIHKRSSMAAGQKFLTAKMPQDREYSAIVLGIFKERDQKGLG